VFANRYTAFVDACAIVGVLKRNLLLTLAEAEFFRLRWSSEVLDETESALARIFAEKGHGDAADMAASQRARMEEAFEDALVTDYDRFKCVCPDLPDQKDVHVVAAALKIQAATIVTDNLDDFPAAILQSLNMEVRSADAFIADTIELDPARAVVAIQAMRDRFKNPALTADDLLLKMEAVGLTETVGHLEEPTDFGLMAT